MSDLELKLRLRADGKGFVGEVTKADKTIGQFSQSIDKSGKASSRASSGYTSAAKGINSISRQLSIAQKSLLSFIGAQQAIRVTKSLINLADQYTLVNARLRLVAPSTREFATAQGELFEIAQQTRTSFDGTVETYTRLARATQSLGISSSQLASVTRTINQALVVSGTSAESANAALIQLGQGLASGTLRGEELNSVLEQAPRLAEAIAKGMGKTVGQLRLLGAQGRITAENVVSSLLNQRKAVETEFNQMPITVGQALVKVSNRFETFIGNISRSTGATKSLAGAISTLADNINVLGNAIVTLSKIALVAFAARFLNAAKPLAKFATAMNLVKGAAKALVPVLQLGLVAAVTAMASPLKTASVAFTLLTRGIAASTTAMLTSITVAGALKFAFRGFFLIFTAFEIGKFLINNFVEAKVAWIKFIGAVSNGWAKMKFAGTVAWEAIKAVARGVIDSIMKGFSKFLRALAAGASKFGLNGISEKLKAYANAIKPASSNAHAFGDAVFNARIELERSTRATNQAVKDNIAFAIAADKAKKSAKKLKDTSDGAAKTMGKVSDAARDIVTQLNPIKQKSKEYNNAVLELVKNQKALGWTDGQLEQAIKRLTKQYGKLNRSIKGVGNVAKESADDIVNVVDPISQIYEDTSTSIRQSFRDTFRQVLDDGVDGFKGLADKVKNIFKDLLADLLTLAASRKIIIPIVTSIGGSLGVSQSALASVAQQLGGGAAAGSQGISGISGIGNLASLGKFLTGGAGIGGGNTLFSVGGFPVSGSMLAQAGFALGAGYLGNRAGNYVSGQLGINRNDGGTVGSVVLGTAGAFIGGPIGAAIGSFVGDIVGNAIGSALGFGKSKVKIQVGTATDLSTAQAARLNNIRTTPFGVVGITDGSNNFGGGLGKGITELLSSIDTSIARLLNASQIDTVKNALTNGRIGVGTRIKAKKFDNEIFTVAKERLVTIIDSLANNQVASKLLNGIEAKQGNVKTLVNKAGEIVQMINLFNDPGEPINAAQQALNALNSKFDQLAGTAKKLGFSIEDVERKRSDQIAKLGADFDKSIRDQILAIEDPVKLALENQAKLAQERIDNAEALGRKLNEVERLNALERAQIIQQQFGSLNDLIRQLTRESLTPVQQIDALVADFNAALAENNIGALNASAQNLITAGRDAFASGPQFQQLKDQLVAALLAVQDRNATGRPADLPPIQITFALDGRVIKEETINDILARSQQGEIVVHSNGVAP